MDTLDRYLVKEFLQFFLVILFLLAALFLGIDFFSNIWDFHLPLESLLVLYACKLPPVLQQMVPIACLMASLMVVSQMSRQNEILALFTAGIGNFRVVSTLIAIVAVLSTCSFLAFDILVPVANKKQELLKRGLTTDELLTSPQTGFWYRSGNLIYKIGHFSADTNTIDNLNVYILDPHFNIVQKVFSPKTQYLSGEWISSKGYLVRSPPGPNGTHFPYGETFETRKSLIPERPTDFKTFHIQEDQMRLKELRKLISRNTAYGLDTTAERVNYHERLALVFTPLIFVLLGLPFTLKPLKSYSMPKSIALCFLIVFVYLLIFRFSLSMGKGGHIPPLLAGWVPNVTFFLLSIGNLIKQR